MGSATRASSPAGCRLFFPLSLTRLLIFFDSDVYRIGGRAYDLAPVKATADDVEALNVLQVVNAGSSLFFSDAADEAYIKRLVASAEAYMSAERTMVDVMPAAQFSLPVGKVIAGRRPDVRINLGLSFVGRQPVRRQVRAPQRGPTASGPRPRGSALAFSVQRPPAAAVVKYGSRLNKWTGVAAYRRKTPPTCNGRPDVGGVANMKRGICRLCGQETEELTKDHVQPQCGFNEKDRLYVRLESILPGGSIRRNQPAIGPLVRNIYREIQPDRPIGGGIYRYTQCQTCNGDLSRHYDSRFGEWCHTALATLKPGEIILAQREYTQRCRCPLSVLKRIVAMFFSINGDHLARLNPDLSRFVREPQSNDLPNRYRFFAAYNRLFRE